MVLGAPKKRGAKTPMFVDDASKRDPKEVIECEKGSKWPSCVRCADKPDGAAICEWDREVIESRLMNLPNKRKNCHACHASKVKCLFEWETDQKRKSSADDEDISAKRLKTDADMAASMQNIDKHLGMLVKYSVVTSVKREEDFDKVSKMFEEIQSSMREMVPESQEDE